MSACMRMGREVKVGRLPLSFSTQLSDTGSLKEPGVCQLISCLAGELQGYCFRPNSQC